MEHQGIFPNYTYWDSMVYGDIGIMNRATGQKLTSEERQENICKHIDERGKISVAELAEIFAVSMQTIRRDLGILKSENKLDKVHGKAIKYTSLYEPMFNERLKKTTLRKRQSVSLPQVLYRITTPLSAIQRQASTHFSKN